MSNQTKTHAAIEARNADGQTIAQHVYVGESVEDRCRESVAFINTHWTAAATFKHHGAEVWTQKGGAALVDDATLRTIGTAAVETPARTFRKAAPTLTTKKTDLGVEIQRGGVTIATAPSLRVAHAWMEDIWENMESTNGEDA